MTKVVGITGGIGSGKTTLSKYLKEKGFLVHESDKIVSNMYKNPSKSFMIFLNKNVSKELVKNNIINKKKIAEIIFNNDDIKKKLEKYIHKEVKIFRKKFIEQNSNIDNRVIFLDIPLLLENKLEKKFDIIVCVVSKKKIRTERVLKRKKFAKEVLNKIFKSQTSDKVRKAKSQIIIKNNQTKKDFIFSIKKALTKILK